MTDSGWKYIVDVTSDLVFDGEEYVSTDGAIYKGKRETVNLNGVNITSDHKVLGDSWSWVTAGNLNKHSELLTSATDLATSKLLKYKDDIKALFTFHVDVSCVKAPQPPLAPTCAEVNLQDVRNAREKNLLLPILNTPLKPLRQKLDDDFKNASQRSLEGALTLTTPPTNNTVRGEYVFTRLGWKTDGNFFSTFLRLMERRTLKQLSIDETTMMLISQATSGSSLTFNNKTIAKILYGLNITVRGFPLTISDVSTHPTTSVTTQSIVNYVKVKALKLLSKIKSTAKVPTDHVYDLANCGVRNRFMVYTNEGPLIIHNCGFLGGTGALASMAAQYRIYVPEDQQQNIVDGWRARHPKVVQFGDRLQAMAMAAMRNEGVWFECGPVAYKFDGTALFCRLPDGKTLLRYPEARIEMTEAPWGDLVPSLTALKAAFKPKADSSEWPRHGLWRGLLLENVVQASCAIMLRDITWEFQDCAVFHVHDELILEVDKDQAEGYVSALQEAMETPPDWCEGLPLKAPAGIMTRYGK